MSEEFAANPHVIPIVSNNGGIVVATSQNVAAYFGKRHDNVLRKFDELDCSDNFRLLNFEETSTVVSMPNGGTRTERAFEMTRDGFVFIAFGFTGKRAAKFKEDYIYAYNGMEAQLARRANADAAAAPVQGQLALSMEINDSLANIDRRMHAIHTGLGAKFDTAVGHIIASMRKHVASPIMDFLVENQRWNEQRFEAIHRRDKLLIESLAHKQDSETTVSIGVAQDMMSVPASHRSAALSRRLSDNARHWFAANGFTARPDGAHVNGPWVFQRSKIAEWWAASGKAIFERAVPKPSADVLPFKAPDRGPAA